MVLTGTPLENSAEDLWSIFDFLHAGLLGTLSSFRAKYAELVKNADLKKELSRRVAPFILRRKKNDVCLELPEKQEQIVYCEMDDEQRKIYAYFAEKARRCYEEVRNSGGNPRNNGGQLAIFANLLRLRQICCNPSLLPEDLRQEYVKNTGNSLQTENSSKMELLQELLQEVVRSIVELHRNQN